MYIYLLILMFHTHCSNVDTSRSTETSDLCKMMADYCHSLLETLVCFHRMQKKKKINVCISSTVVIVSLVSYGTHYGTHDLTHEDPSSMSHWPLALPQVKNERHETPTSFLCYTNNANILRTWRRNSKIFPAKVSETDLVFLSIGNDIKEISTLNQYPFQNHCFTINEKFLFHCCGYSPFLKESKMHFTIHEANFSYERRAITDTSIRMEDIINGKPEMVDLTIKAILTTENHTKTEITARHRCRGDVIVDPYPEIHINVGRHTLNGSVTKKEFHWFL